MPCKERPKEYHLPVGLGKEAMLSGEAYLIFFSSPIINVRIETGPSSVLLHSK